MESMLQKTTKPKRRKTNLSQGLNPDLLLRLSELLQGERDMVMIYSKALQSDICFVNTALCDPETLQIDCPIYTTRELAFVLSLSDEEFRRFHYLKTKLID